MYSLKEKISIILRHKGSMTLEKYMSLCLCDPEYGYYFTQEPFGKKGDFITAPEISQMFGELIAAWIIHIWTILGSPQNTVLAEAGPGRGTLMKDIVRVFSKLAPDLMKKISWQMIETSPRLIAIQNETLQNYDINVSWIQRIEDLQEGYLFIIANEWLDAIPIKQFVYTKEGWRERCIAQTQENNLVYTCAQNLPCIELPEPHKHRKEGEIQEVSPQRGTLIRNISKRVKHHGGVGLFIDYGYTETQSGDTLQALYKKRFCGPLMHPGNSDLTSHVDFKALTDIILEEGLQPHLTDQAHFLLEIGLAERMYQLSKNTHHKIKAEIRYQAHRLSSPQEMGSLFKVLAFSSPEITLPGFSSKRL